jgi:hypothetical protein
MEAIKHLKTGNNYYAVTINSYKQQQKIIAINGCGRFAGINIAVSSWQKKVYNIALDIRTA